MYGVSEKDLTNLNADAFRNGKLLNGALLELPAQQVALIVDNTADEPASTSADCAKEQLYAKDRTYKVALLLPLESSPVLQGDLIVNSGAKTSDPAAERSRNADNFLEFYEGALLAVEDMKNLGMRMELSVFDLLKKGEDIASLLNNNSLRNFDLIIGPAHAQEFQLVAEYAKQHSIRIVSPIDSRTEGLIQTNPYVFQVNPPTDAQYLKLFDGINVNNDKNVVLVYEEGLKEEALIEGLLDALEHHSETVKFVTYSPGKTRSARDTIMSFLRPLVDNRIVIASNNEVMVTEILSNLHQLSVLKKYDITVYGTSRWRNFDGIDLAYFHELRLHMAVPFFADYDASTTKEFIVRYRDNFNAEPSQYAFQGYDVFTYFMQCLMNYGPRFDECFPSLSPRLLQSDYKFFRTDSRYGFINVDSARIVYTPEYTIERN